jgi:hypothetical protein
VNTWIGIVNTWIGHREHARIGIVNTRIGIVNAWIGDRERRVALGSREAKVPWS